MSERPGLTEAEREASRWIVRLESPDVSLEDHQRFRAWLSASEENQRAYRALSDTWDKLDLLKKDYAPASARGRSARTSPRTAIASRRALLLGGGGAAVIAVGAAAVWLASPSTTFAASYETAIGGRETARLQDGSVVELNADTAIAVTYNGDLRSCSLGRGEALFTVAADGRPFEVRTAFGTFVAQGTSFVVKLMDDAARASVLEGEVRAERSGSGAERLIASASNEIVLMRDEALVSEISEERAAARTAWREGVLVFDGETLEEAAADVARQTGLRFVFEDEEVAGLRVGGLIDARDGQAFVDLVESNLGLRVEARNDGSVLLAR